MEITFILKGNFEGLPPMLPRIIEMSKKGIKCNLICTKIAESTKKIFNDNSIRYRETLHSNKFMGKSNRFSDWIRFKSGCKKILNSEYANSDYLYICSADTALCLNSLLKKNEYVLQSNELYDQFPMYRKGLKKYALAAKAFVVPEFCRSNIFMYWYGLKRKPYVIPNIPYTISLSKNQIISDQKAKGVVESLSNKKILIYQGHIVSGDRSLTVIAEALKKINNDDYVLLLMGRNYNNSYEELKAIYEQTFFVPFIAAPYHLEVTSHAHIALLSYDRVSLNNLFCAPNKIFEYSGLGIPMLGNDIPGLIHTIDYERIGMCAPYDDVDKVVDAINVIEKNHSEFSKNAEAFFEKNDLSKMIDDLLLSLSK